MALLLFIAWRKRESLGKCPTSEKMLRPPGESLRKYREKLDEELFTKITWFLIASIFAASLFCLGFHFLSAFPIISIVLICAGLVLMFFVFRPLLKLQTQFLNNGLGLHGERVVGEHLNRLMLDGCEVFHDLQLSDNWNIDHVVVSPCGVFAVETKAYRKPDTEDGHKVFFTGTELQFPTWTDRDDLKQAADNARQLADFLTKSTGERVEVAPILTLPGWWVELKGKGPVSVLNPKLIGGVVLDSRRPFLDKAQRKRICHQLEQKCRDVEM